MRGLPLERRTRRERKEERPRSRKQRREEACRQPEEEQYWEQAYHSHPLLREVCRRLHAAAFRLQAVDWEEGSCLRHGHEEFKTTIYGSKGGWSRKVEPARPSPPEYISHKSDLRF